MASKASKIVGAALGVTMAAAIPTTAFAQSSADVNALANDTKQAASDFQKALSISVKNKPPLTKLGVNFIIQGIDFGCGGLTASMDGVKQCLNTLYGAIKEVKGNEGALKRLDGLRDRWRGLKGLPTISSNSSGNVDWKLSEYPKFLRPTMKAAREGCSDVSLSKPNGQKGCFQATWVAALNVSDSLRFVLDKSKAKTNDGGVLRGLDQGIKNLDEKCTKPLKDTSNTSPDKIKTCVQELKFVGFGHVEEPKKICETPINKGGYLGYGMREVACNIKKFTP